MAEELQIPVAHDEHSGRLRARCNRKFQLAEIGHRCDSVRTATGEAKNAV
jgi:hypothetical protein